MIFYHVGPRIGAAAHNRAHIAFAPPDVGVVEAM